MEKIFLGVMAVGMILIGCTTRQLNVGDYQECKMTCRSHGGIDEICITYFSGRGCRCNDGLLVWKPIE